MANDDKVWELRVKAFVVKNLNTDKGYEFASLYPAEKYLNEMRAERPGAEWQIYAILSN